MKLFGYTHEAREADSIVPSHMAEVTLLANPTELRRIAAFLETAARAMEEMGDSFSHVHLADQDKRFDETPQFVVAGPDTKHKD